MDEIPQIKDIEASIPVEVWDGFPQELKVLALFLFILLQAFIFYSIWRSRRKKDVSELQEVWNLVTDSALAEWVSRGSWQEIYKKFHRIFILEVYRLSKQQLVFLTRIEISQLNQIGQWLFLNSEDLKQMESFLRRTDEILFSESSGCAGHVELDFQFLKKLRARSASHNG